MMENYIVTPESNPCAGILVLHAWWGLNDFLKSFCDRLAREGYIALATDLYHCEIARTIPEAKKLHDKLKRDAVSQDILTALTHLQSQPSIQGKPVGVIGFSLGAYWSLWLAEEKPEELAATVLFYGARGGEYTKTPAAFLGHFAESDQYLADSGRKNLEKTLRTAGKEIAFHVYPRTHHWFFENDRPEYEAQAASLAWQRTVEFLQEHIL